MYMTALVTDKYELIYVFSLLLIEVAMSLLFKKYDIIIGGHSHRNQLSYYFQDIGLRLCNVDPEICCDIQKRPEYVFRY